MKTFCNFALQSTFKMNKNEAAQTLDQIKDLMTRSRKFLTLSGTTAILIGLYACVSAGIAFSLLDNGQPFRWDRFPELLDHTPGHLTELLILAVALIALCIATAVALCWHQARKNEQRLVFDAPARRLAGSFALPLVVGGLLCLSLFRHGFYGLSSSIMLIFYGLSLVLGCQPHLFVRPVVGLRRDRTRTGGQLHGRLRAGVLDPRFRRAAHRVRYRFLSLKPEEMNLEGIDKTLESKVRLGIMSVLAVNDSVDFVTLKSLLELTHGNLVTHLRNLETAGYLTVHKQFLGRKPHTAYTATPKGLEAFRRHLDALETFIRENKR